MRDFLGLLFLVAVVVTIYCFWLALKELLIALIVLGITVLLYYAATSGKESKKKKP
ncbi:hypothetical protein F982_03749 [Acinetobacter baumannii NIPH 1362]|nr:hypothetical protein F982_03749 [Acinetobacter baumannii NIPH 1362]